MGIPPGKGQPGQNPKPPGPGTLDPNLIHIHCPRLGGEVPLKYCLKPAQDTPCFRIMDCWWQTIDIQALLETHLQPDELQSFLKTAQPKTRLDQILDILDRLKDKPPT